MLEKKWAKAKKDYDESYKESKKARDKLEKEYDALYKAAQKEHKKLKVDKKLDALIKDPVLARMHGQGLIKHIDLLNKKKSDIHKIPRLKERKRTGAEPAFREVDKVFQVALKLQEAQVEDPKKWEKWRDLAKHSLKSCAKAEKKFNDWMQRADYKAEIDFQTDFENIFKKMSETGGPMLKHANRTISG